MHFDLAKLCSEHSVEGLRWSTDNHGLIRFVIESERCDAEMYLHGAHITKFAPKGHKSILWMSSQSIFHLDKPIRGGVPICFPWFGPHPVDSSLPSHGWARIQTWDLKSVTKTPAGVFSVEMTTTIKPFKLRYVVNFSETLEMLLYVSLLDTHPTATYFEEALHSYFAVSSIHDIQILGLENAQFIDKVDSARLKEPAKRELLFSGEIDRVYLDATSETQLVDPGLSRTIKITKRNSSNTVVWNPWIEKSRRMPDFGDDEWTKMVCIETANVLDHKILVSAGEEHLLAVQVEAFHH